MAVKVTTLVENYVKGRGLFAEHGLSMLFEAGGKLFLFDTGASDLFIDNANVLGKRIEDVDFLILSHGHSDHTGGLRAFLDVNLKAKVFCKHSVLTPKFRGNRENGIGDITGLDLSRFVFVDNFSEIMRGVFVIADICVVNENDTHFSNFELLTEQGRVADLFDDELAVVIADDSGFSLISACSHRGITNIISSVRRYLPTQKFKYLVGGFHLVDSPLTDALCIIDYLKSDLPEHIGVCHCSGLDSYAVFKNEFKDRVFYNYCGLQFLL